MDTCNRISKLSQSENYEMQVVGIPKTIDNDLPYTDHCPGFGNFITDEFRKYCLPLLGDPLPEYARLMSKPVTLL